MNTLFCRSCGKPVVADATDCPHCNAPQYAPEPVTLAHHKSQAVATLLCAFFGLFGAHRFYLGPKWVGVVYVLLCWTGIPGLVSFVETIRMALASPETWAQRHNEGVIGPRLSLWIKIPLLAISLMGLLGLVAAVALPAYQTHVLKAQTIQAYAHLQQARPILAQHLYESEGTAISSDVQLKLEQTLRMTPKFIAIDTYAQGDYADVGVRFTNTPARLYLVTHDGGASWQCVGTQAQAHPLPPGCASVAALERPTARPRPRIADTQTGQWSVAAYQSFLSRCKNSAEKAGMADPEGPCRCLSDRASQTIPEEDLIPPLPASTQQAMSTLIDECGL